MEQTVYDALLTKWQLDGPAVTPKLLQTSADLRYPIALVILESDGCTVLAQCALEYVRYRLSKNAGYSWTSYTNLFNQLLANSIYAKGCYQQYSGYTGVKSPMRDSCCLWILNQLPAVLRRALAGSTQNLGITRTALDYKQFLRQATQSLIQILLDLDTNTRFALLEHTSCSYQDDPYTVDHHRNLNFMYSLLEQNTHESARRRQKHRDIAIRWTVDKSSETLCILVQYLDSYASVSIRVQSP